MPTMSLETEEKQSQAAFFLELTDFYQASH